MPLPALQMAVTSLNCIPADPTYYPCSEVLCANFGNCDMDGPFETYQFYGDSINRGFSQDPCSGDTVQSPDCQSDPQYHLCPVLDEPCSWGYKHEPCYYDGLVADPENCTSCACSVGSPGGNGEICCGMTWAKIKIVEMDRYGNTSPFNLTPRLNEEVEFALLFQIVYGCSTTQYDTCGPWAGPLLQNAYPGQYFPNTGTPPYDLVPKGSRYRLGPFPDKITAAWAFYGAVKGIYEIHCEIATHVGSEWGSISVAVS